MRLAYPASIKIIRIPCTGKIDELHMLKAFQKGADGVAVVGCLEGSCHYAKGNIRARARVERVRSMLKEAGLEGDRVTMVNLSASDGPGFAGHATEMTRRIRALGPNPLREEK